jgi:8-oxo-dGTP diphosphatase
MRARVAVTVAVLAVENDELKVGLHQERHGNSVVFSLPMRIAVEADDLDLLAEALANTVVTNEVVLMQQTGAYLVAGSEHPTLVVGYRGLCRGAPVRSGESGPSLGSVHELLRAAERSQPSIVTEVEEPHREVLEEAVRWLEQTLERSLVAAEFCGPRFTIAELREVYEAVWATKLDRSNFQRKVTNPKLKLVRKVRRTSGTGLRVSAAIYERGSGWVIHPPIRRPAPIKRKRRRHRSVWSVAVPFLDELGQEDPEPEDDELGQEDRESEDDRDDVG